jgi:hypothetical protein
MLKKNIFIVGNTKSGKTTLAKKIATKFNLEHVSASQWFRDNFKGDPSSPAFVKEISVFSSQTLKANSNLNIEILQPKIVEGGCVIEGVRNPRDFNALFIPERGDVVIWLYSLSSKHSSVFEAYGLKAIRHSLKFYLETGIMEQARCLRFEVADVSGPDHSCSGRALVRLPARDLDHYGDCFAWNMDIATKQILEILDTL